MSIFLIYFENTFDTIFMVPTSHTKNNEGVVEAFIRRLTLSILAMKSLTRSLREALSCSICSLAIWSCDRRRMVISSHFVVNMVMSTSLPVVWRCNRARFSICSILGFISVAMDLVISECLICCFEISSIDVTR